MKFTRLLWPDGRSREAFSEERCVKISHQFPRRILIRYTWLMEIEDWCQGKGPMRLKMCFFWLKVGIQLLMLPEYSNPNRVVSRAPWYVAIPPELFVATSTFPSNFGLQTAAPWETALPKPIRKAPVSIDLSESFHNSTGRKYRCGSSICLFEIDRI